jgi:hypothetical protein
VSQFFFGTPTDKKYGILVTTQPYMLERLNRSLRELGERLERVLKTLCVFKTRKNSFLGGRSPRLAERPLRLSNFEFCNDETAKAVSSLQKRLWDNPIFLIPV